LDPTNTKYLEPYYKRPTPFSPSIRPAVNFDGAYVIYDTVKSYPAAPFIDPPKNPLQAQVNQEHRWLWNNQIAYSIPNTYNEDHVYYFKDELKVKSDFRRITGETIFQKFQIGPNIKNNLFGNTNDGELTFSLYREVDDVTELVRDSVIDDALNINVTQQYLEKYIYKNFRSLPDTAPTRIGAKLKVSYDKEKTGESGTLSVDKGENLKIEPTFLPNTRTSTIYKFLTGEFTLPGKRNKISLEGKKIINGMILLSKYITTDMFPSSVLEYYATTKPEQVQIVEVPPPSENPLQFKNRWNPNIRQDKYLYRRVNLETSFDEKTLKVNFNQPLDSTDYNFDYYFDLIFTKKSFLYKQKEVTNDSLILIEPAKDIINDLINELTVLNYRLYDKLKSGAYKGLLFKNFRKVRNKNRILELVSDLLLKGVLEWELPNEENQNFEDTPDFETRFNSTTNDYETVPVEDKFDKKQTGSFLLGIIEKNEAAIDGLQKYKKDFIDKGRFDLNRSLSPELLSNVFSTSRRLTGKIYKSPTFEPVIDIKIIENISQVYELLYNLLVFDSKVMTTLFEVANERTIKKASNFKLLSKQDKRDLDMKRSDPAQKSGVATRTKTTRSERSQVSNDGQTNRSNKENKTAVSNNPNVLTGDKEKNKKYSSDNSKSRTSSGSKNSRTSRR
jgi:hypothetical protein